MHKDGRGYAYETFRDASGRVRRKYLGAGDGAELALEFEQLRHKAEAAERVRQEGARDRERSEVENPVAHLDCQTRAIVEELLTAAGYHRPRRGVWRKKRQPMSKDIMAMRAALQERAQHGDLEAARAFWQAVDSDPTRRAELVRQTGDVAGVALGNLMQRITGGDLVAWGGIRRHLDTMRLELGGINATPLELLLVERVCVCWLQLHYFEAAYMAELPEATAEQEALRQKQVDGASRRYLASIKALAQIRKLQLPALQISLAEQQINIGG